MKLGTICLASFPLRDPILLAIQWASLDLLSHGRTILAVCHGGSALDGPPFAHELEVMGVKSYERVGRVLQGITILRRVWSEARVTHQGKYYRFADVELLQKPVQQPLPIYMAINPKEACVDAATIDRILRRVAAHADGWQTDATPVETFRQRFDTIRNYAARQGRNPAKLDSCLHLMVNINDDRNSRVSVSVCPLSHLTFLTAESAPATPTPLSRLPDSPSAPSNPTTTIASTHMRACVMISSSVAQGSRLLLPPSVGGDRWGETASVDHPYPCPPPSKGSGCDAALSW